MSDESPEPITPAGGSSTSKGALYDWRIRHSKAIGNVGWGFFLVGLAAIFAGGPVNQAAEWGWFEPNEVLVDALEQAGGFAIIVAIAIGLTHVSESVDIEQAPTSERLQEVMERFEGLDDLLQGLASEVKEMAESSVAVERRAREAQALLDLTTTERSALTHELERLDKAGTKRDVMLFAAGVAAGVVTNLIVR